MTETYESLRERGFEALRAGDLSGSRNLLEAAVQAAEREGAGEMVDAARCNLSMVLLQGGETERAEDGLRELLLRSQNPRIQRAASYTLAVALKSRRQYDKAVFYARKSLRACRGEGHDPIAIASSYNLLGTIAMSRSQLRLAERYFAVALGVREKHVPEESDPGQYYRVVYLDNLGYCRVLRDNLAGGIPLLREAFRIASETGLRRYVSESAQDLCFGLLRNRLLEEAAVWGTRALEAADAEGYADIRKNCFYLLGEIYSLLGEEGKAAGFFDRLQAHYPDLPFLRDFLRTFDISGMITLKEF